MLVIGCAAEDSSAAEQDFAERLRSPVLAGVALLLGVEGRPRAGRTALLITPDGLRCVDVEDAGNRVPRPGGGVGRARPGSDVAGRLSGVLADRAPEAGPVLAMAVVYGPPSAPPLVAGPGAGTGAGPGAGPWTTTPERFPLDLAALEPFPLTLSTARAVLTALDLPPMLVPPEDVLREQGFAAADGWARGRRDPGPTAEFPAGFPAGAADLADRIDHPDRPPSATEVPLPADALGVLGAEPLFVPDEWVEEEIRRRRRSRRPKLLVLLALLLLGLAAFGLSRLSAAEGPTATPPTTPVPTVTSSPEGGVAARDVTAAPTPVRD
ncbi:hypothetical protein ACFFKU_07790 [Kineococcus gynurae]|uniref:Uncharacterized protein n=2 Tax=Kineococcus gynurae TaxID=452979 RepID=A0ABV5LWH5_9ACTN